MILSWEFYRLYFITIINSQDILISNKYFFCLLFIYYAFFFLWYLNYWNMDNKLYKRMLVKVIFVYMPI